MTKKALRQQLRQYLTSISPAELQERSMAACQLLREQKEYQRADVIMIFLTMAREVDTTPIALAAWHDAKRVLAPLVLRDQHRMLPVEIQSLTTDMQPGERGINEPAEGLPVPVSDIDLVVVPGLGFDRRGNRLGSGSGFYDRFLAHRDFRGISCALAFEDQMIESIPIETTDVPVQMLVTDVCVRRFVR